MIDSNLLFQSCLKNLYFFVTSKTPFELRFLMFASR